jgi:alpha-beta hydrolase superfamily lysophospholipase
MIHFETDWYSADGLRLYAQGWEPETSRKAVVCLVHGIGEHTSRFKHVAEALTASGYVLFGSDWRGHGRSEGKRGHIPSIEAVLKDIDILVEKARDRYPGLPVYLYGQSLGAILVLYYSLKRKPDIAGVIATSPALRSSLDKQPVKIAAAKVLGSIIPSVTLHSGLVPEQLSRDKKVVSDYVNDPMVHFRMSLGFGKILLGVRKWVLAHSREFTLPLLIMHGKEDEIAYFSSSVDFAAPITEKCILVLWDGALHELHNEPEKEDVLKAIIEWLGNEEAKSQISKK